MMTLPLLISVAEKLLIAVFSFVLIKGFISDKIDYAVIRRAFICVNVIFVLWLGFSLAEQQLQQSEETLAALCVPNQEINIENLENVETINIFN